MIDQIGLDDEGRSKKLAAMGTCKKYQSPPLFDNIDTSYMLPLIRYIHHLLGHTRSFTGIQFYGEIPGS